MSEQIDIAVIGASPAGLMAARYAAMGGARVTLFEKKDRIGNDPHPANSFFKGMMNYTGEKVDSSYVVHEIDGMKLISPGGRTVTVKTPGYAINKSVFDRFYEQKAIAAGVNIVTGTAVTDVKRKENGIVLKTMPSGCLDPEKKEKVKAKIVIIADGILSKNAKAAGLSTMKHPEDIAWGTELEIKAPGIGKSDFAEYYVGSHAPGWKSSYLPRGGDNAAIGVYVRYFGKDVSQFLNPWVEKFKELKGISDDEFSIVESKSAGDPIITIPDRIYAPNIMVAGGAAGQSGIGYAMRAGQLAGTVGAKAIAKDDYSEKTLSAYYSQWKKDLYIEHTFGRIGLETLRKMDDTEIDELFDVFEGEDVSSLIQGSAMDQGLSVLSLMLKKKPSAILKAGAYFRNR
ncbi:NAD(P)/FAD-dependent oxidoreductase [Methanolapillus ohkumae]|uniref:Thiamine thiazole synthase n=1 Tax=Methanolapillus ohkumae TaxID=3028298 RepID=A0AA96V787_9EURY|nr:Thiamine thiazole synthase [Methanosarcinaceae archaeon Am2]